MALGREGFASASDTYERGRPPYPDALIDHLTEHWDLTATSTVADVAAGTGKLSRQLRAAGARCVAVEPSASMRAECRRVSPDTEIVAGSAEALPLADDAFDLVTVAQAFHWFDARRALHELARVLRPGGVVVLVWNDRETSLPWAGALDRILHAAGSSSCASPEDVRPRFEGDPHFGPFAPWAIGHHVPMRAADVEDMVTSRSYVRVLPPEHRRAVVQEVSAVTAPLPQVISMPYTTKAYCARATPGPCACSGSAPDARPEVTPWSD